MKNCNKEDFQEYLKKNTPKTAHAKNMSFAFIVGGIICMIGQGFFDLYARVLPNFDKMQLSTLTTITMIFLGALFTGLGLYDKIGSRAGAGSIIPITGFANSIVSPAMEFRREGVIFGTMSKMFTIAGPIIVSGVCASVFVGVVYYIVGLF